MKKAIALFMVLSMLTLSGCNYISGYLSSDNQSDIVTIYDYNSSEMEELMSQIESEIAQKEQNGEITVSRDTEVIVVDEDDDELQSGADDNTVIIDSTLKPDNADNIVETGVNTIGEKPLYYTYLTEPQQKIYRLMLTAISEMKEGLFSIGREPSTQGRFTDISIAFCALNSDNPQFFWIPDTYVVSSDGSMIAFSYKEKGAQYTFSVSEKLSAEQKLNAVVDQLCAEAQKLDSRFEKEIYFHDWLCQNVKYQKDGSSSAYTAYGALVNGIAVCEGYSRAMQLLCDKVGIPCAVVRGKTNDIGHMWNVIDLGDGWCYLDVTWDDDEVNNVIRHDYINLTTNQISKDHQFYQKVEKGKTYLSTDNFNIQLYDCVSEEYNYFKRKNLVFTDDVAAATKIILNANSSGKNSIEVKFAGSGDRVVFLKSINRMLFDIGYQLQISKYLLLDNTAILWW